MIQFPIMNGFRPLADQATGKSFDSQWDRIMALEDSCKDAWTIAYFGLLGIMRKNGWGVMTERPSLFRGGKLWHKSLDWGEQKFQGSATKKIQ